MSELSIERTSKEREGQAWRDGARKKQNSWTWTAV